MKASKISYFLIIIGILLCLSGIAAVGSLLTKAGSLAGIHGMQKITVSFQKGSAGTDNLTAGNIHALCRILGTNDMTYSVCKTTIIDVGNKNTYANIIATNHKFLDFCGFKLYSGRFLSQADEENGKAIAVIDEKLALELFRSKEVLQKSIRISGKQFKIAGIIKTDGFIESFISENITRNVYIPYSASEHLGDIAFTYLQVSTDIADEPVISSSRIKTALIQVGKNASEYNLEDYRTKELEMRQKLDILVFVPGFVCLLMMLLYIIRQFRWYFKIFAVRLKDEYFMEAFRSTYTILLAATARAAIVTAGMAAVWTAIRFTPYIPQSYIPDNIFDISSYLDIVKNCIRHARTLDGGASCLPGLALDKSSGIAGFAFYISFFTGTPVALLGIYQMKLLRKSLPTDLCKEGGKIL